MYTEDRHETLKEGFKKKTTPFVFFDSIVFELNHAFLKKISTALIRE